MIAALASTWIALSAGSDPDSRDAKLRALADRCGSQIAWLRDQIGPDDGGAAFQYVERGPRAGPADLERLLAEALERARAERKLVLWHVYRLQGGHMYRAPLLDDYMDQLVWSDPALVELVQRAFVPLRTQCPQELGGRFGLKAWDVVEPVVLFLEPDGTVAHRIDRIRTFHAGWFGHVFRRVLAAHPGFDPPAAAAAEAFATFDGVRLEASRRDYHEALVKYLDGDETAALEGWQRLVDSEPASPFAWRAAANLLPAPDRTFVGAARHGFEWPFEVHLDEGGAIPVDTRWRRTPAEAEAVADAAVRYLLRTQRPDGGWNDCRYAYWDSPEITPNAWMAITALCATALSEWRDLAPDRIEPALARAEEYLLRTGRVNAGRNEEVYAHAYRVLYLTRTLAQTEDRDQRAELLGRVQGLVDQLARLQRASGQWAHEYDNAFCTAVVLDALEQARGAGASVPDATVARGLDGLEGARFEDGSFCYGGRLGQGAKPAPDSLKNSCGRMPLCEGTLFAWGRSDARRLARALAVFRDHFDRFEKVSKCDFHTDGELGGFFFFHDLFHASETLRRLPEPARQEMGRFLLERITLLPEVDGSFLDDHEIGKACSTGFALLALRNSLATGPAH